MDFYIYIYIYIYAFFFVGQPLFLRHLSNNLSWETGWQPRKILLSPLTRGRLPESNRVTTSFVISSATPKSR